MIDPANIPSTVYYLSGAVALAGWLSIFFFPRRTWSTFWFGGIIAPVILCLLSTFLLLTSWFQPPAASVFDYLKLSTVYRQYGNTGLLAVTLIDIIAMNLVVGAWMARKARQVGISYVYLFPCLLFMTVAPGGGFLIFAIVVSVQGRWGTLETADAGWGNESRPVSATPSSKLQTLVH
ncbi:MAG: DUF4281 domain-containing protein [Acidobacteria bacterium]|nr:DUF4281 domain-containing protein [Acidobacteriota bacterium]MBV9477674.1 DUF4281 domain-containing protein [Acidobacteriota bacterium]